MKDILLAVSICVGACTSVVPGTWLQLQELDPLSADPADIALQVDLPDGIALLPGSGTLDLRAVRVDGIETSGSFPIEMAEGSLAGCTCRSCKVAYASRQDQGLEGR